METDYGQDISSAPDLSFKTVSGGRVVMEAIVRRLHTPRGSLFYAPDYGLDIREMLLARMTESILFEWKARIEQEILADDRVVSANADVTYLYATEQIGISIQVVLLDGEPAAVDLVSRPAAGGDAPSAAAASPAFDVIYLYQ